MSTFIFLIKGDEWEQKMDQNNPEDVEAFNEVSGCRSGTALNGEAAVRFGGLGLVLSSEEM